MSHHAPAAWSAKARRWKPTLDPHQFRPSPCTSVGLGYRGISHVDPPVLPRRGRRCPWPAQQVGTWAPGGILSRFLEARVVQAPVGVRLLQSPVAPRPISISRLTSTPRRSPFSEFATALQCRLPTAALSGTRVQVAEARVLTGDGSTKR